MREKLKPLLDHLTYELIAFVGVSVLVFIRGLRKKFQSPSGLVATITKENGMQKVSVTMEVPKESKEVIDALTGLLADIKAKKNLQEVIGGALPRVIAAVDGFGQLGEEVKSDGKDELAGYAVREILLGLGI